MEEVDQTIIPILQDVGCNFGGKTSVSAFETNDIVQACSRALHAVNEKHKFPIKLPESNAARFRICTSISEAITDLGFTGELGYQAFLYPNERDMRKLLIWLIDKLPKTAEVEAEIALGPRAMFEKSLTDSLQAWSSKSFDALGAVQASTSMAPLGFATVPLEVPKSGVSKETSAYYKDIQPLLNQQPLERADFVPSLLEHHSHEIALAVEREKDWELGNVEQRRAERQANVAKLVTEAFRLASTGDGSKGLSELVGDMLSTYESTRMGRQTEFEVEKDDAADVGADTKEDDEDTVRARLEAELQTLQEQLSELDAQIAQFMEGAQRAIGQAQIRESELALLQAETKKLEQAYKIKKHTLDLLPNAEENLEKLQQIADQSAQRLVKLGEEWETHRVPLLAKYRRKKQLTQDRMSNARVKLEQIKSMRAEQKQMAQDIRERDAQHKQVLEELNRLPKSINRQVYVRRIMDIVKNLDKQKADIRKILEDVRAVQKDINMISETSKRSFAVTDEVIFRSTQKTLPGGKKDPQATKSYKYLVQLRKGFDQLVQTVEDMGRAKNDIRDLTSRIDTLESRNTQLNTERIKEDLAQVKKENKNLSKQLKKAGGGSTADDEE